jgi:hypothetical protein
LLQSVYMAAGNVAFLAARVQVLSEQKALLQTADTAAGIDRTFTHMTDAYDVGGGLFGPTIELDRDGAEHVVGEEYRAMLKLYNEWSDKLVKYAKAAVDAGIAKAQVELAQTHGQQIVIIVNNVLARLGLDEAKRIVARELLAEEFARNATTPKEVTVG